MADEQAVAVANLGQHDLDEHGYRTASRIHEMAESFKPGSRFSWFGREYVVKSKDRVGDETWAVLMECGAIFHIGQIGM